MKKRILILSTTFLSALFTNSVHAQQWTSAGGNDIQTDPSTPVDKVGIGMIPTEKLSVNGNISTEGNLLFHKATDNVYRTIYGGSNNYGLALFGNNDWTNGAGMLLNGGNTTTDKGSISFVASSQGASNEAAFNFANWDPNANSGAGGWRNHFIIDNDGDIILRNNNGNVNNYNVIKGHSSHSGLVMYGNTYWDDGASILLNGGNTSSDKGSITFVASNQGAWNEAAFNFANWDPNANGGTGGWENRFIIDNDGDITLRNNDGNANNYNVIKGHSSHSGLVLYGNTNWDNGGSILLNGGHTATDRGSITFVASSQGAGNEAAFNFANWDPNANGGAGGWNNHFVIENSGKIVVGDVSTATTNDYKLYVQTGILTEKVKVALSNDPNNWSDFVFDESYELRSLNEVETYIKENKHLPEIPSTEEVHANGLDLAQMDAKLLQKIEELTLYIIQQQKEIDELKSKLNK